ncbi:MAG TPA: hypothetical protein VG318_01375 [Actinomycetota bacterium]|nr:hypothetical protein [Actinomycetota bacterium]
MPPTDRQTGGPVSFLLLGDRATECEPVRGRAPAAREADGAELAIIASDVTDRAGELRGCDKKFFRPYRDLDCPIYAIPGNDDWYDGLHGFMSHICGIDAPQAPLEVGPGIKGKIARALWRRTMRPDDQTLATAITWAALCWYFVQKPELPGALG